MRRTRQTLRFSKASTRENSGFVSDLTVLFYHFDSRSRVSVLTREILFLLGKVEVLRDFDRVVNTLNRLVKLVHSGVLPRLRKRGAEKFANIRVSEIY